MSKVRQEKEKKDNSRLRDSVGKDHL